MLSVSNFRNVTYLNPRKHRHIPRPPDGVLMPKKVGIMIFLSIRHFQGRSFMIHLFRFVWGWGLLNELMWILFLDYYCSLTAITPF